MTITVRVLCENAVYGNLGAIGEHGWSVWIETPEGPLLYDTGQGKALLNNAAFFNVPLTDAQAILISHHHSDHTGGMLDALTSMRGGPGGQGVPIYAHPDLFKDSYNIDESPTKFIGLPFTRSVLENTGADFRLETGWREVSPNVYMTGEVPRHTDFELGDPHLMHVDPTGKLVVDPIRDDQTVIVDTADGLFVILGCSHAGIVNILHYITEKTGQSHFHTVMGGTHLGLVGEEQVAKSIVALHDFDIDHIGVSHCTGQAVAARMASEFAERFFFCSVGTVVSI